MKAFALDTIIAVGGGSPMDVAKIMWVLYEHPEVKFEDLAMRFMDIRKRVYKFPTMGEKAMMIAVPTFAGTGSEVTPFALITDEKTGVKYPLADYALTPDMAIIDAELMMNMPKDIASTGISEKDFYASLDEMCEQAFDDQCTGANPRYQLISEIKEMYINTYKMK